MSEYCTWFETTRTPWSAMMLRRSVSTISGGKTKVQDDKGTGEGHPKTGGFSNIPPTPWHEVTNIGDTTLNFLVIEKKYEPVATK